MKWVQRHLNWTIVIASFVYLGVIFPLLNLLAPIDNIARLAGASLSSSIAFLFIVTMVEGKLSLFFIPAGVVSVIWWFTLKEKGRSTKWILLPVFIPFGWIALLLLKNERHPRV